MAIIKRAIDYQLPLPNGQVQIYAGHPCYCMRQERHKAHLFFYVYRHADGSTSQGQYVCTGEGHVYPVRWIDKTLDDETA